MAVVDRTAHLWRFCPIDIPQVLHHAERIARSWQHLRLRGIRGRRLLARRCHALDGLHFLPTFAQVHLILQARQRSRIAVGVELIIKLEKPFEHGFWVCAKACKCHVLFPRKLPRPATCSLRVATSLSLETLAVYSRTSPARSGTPVSMRDVTLFEPANNGDFSAATLAGFSAGGASRKTGWLSRYNFRSALLPMRMQPVKRAAAQPSTASAATLTAVL